jgi:hypothetical protein
MSYLYCFVGRFRKVFNQNLIFLFVFQDTHGSSGQGVAAKDSSSGFPVYESHCDVGSALSSGIQAQVGSQAKSMAATKSKKMKCTMEGCTHKNMQILSAFSHVGEQRFLMCNSCRMRVSRAKSSSSEVRSNIPDEEIQPQDARMTFLHRLLETRTSRSRFPPPTHPAAPGSDCCLL